MDLHREERLPVVIFRPGIVIGRGSSPLHWGVGMWSWDAVCQLWGRGETPLPLVLVDDVAAALVAALEAPGIEGEAFNLIADSGITARQYLGALERGAGVEFHKIPTPPWKFYLADVVKWVVKRAIRHPDRRPPSLRDWETRTQRPLRLLQGPQAAELGPDRRAGRGHPPGDRGAGPRALRLRPTPHSFDVADRIRLVRSGADPRRAGPVTGRSPGREKRPPPNSNQARRSQ